MITLNIVDAIIILVILAGAVFGFKRGFTKQLLSFVGIFLVVILSFVLKNPISIFLYEHLPFFKFGGILKGVTVLNIALYEFIALLIIMSILTLILKLLVFASSIFETILKFTIILGIPSKILGAIVGMIESFVWVFIGLYILSLPMFHIDMVNSSHLKDGILKNTPILSNIAGDTVRVIEKFEKSPNANEFNKETLKLFLDYNIITVKSVDQLIAKNKLEIDGIENVLSCYREHSVKECRERNEN